MSFIEIKDLTKQYYSSEKPVLALRGLNLDVQENEICSIMGPSGCGKSTLLNILGTIDEPTSGFARVGNFPISAPARSYFGRSNRREVINYRRNNIGFIFQFHNLSPVHTALENVELPMVFSGVPRQERMKRSQQLLEEVGLANRAQHKPDQLSGGERQRVAVATAFANNPTLILADEPTGELDQDNTDMVCDLIMKMKKERDFSMILVTHNPMVARLGDNVYSMRDGIIRGIIDKSVLKNLSDFSSGVQQEVHAPSINDFPPKFCTACGSSELVRPSYSSRSGFWTETNTKKMEFEFEFAQCQKCGKIYWNVLTVTEK